MNKRISILITLLTLTIGVASAQHTLGVSGGYGLATARFYPSQETKAVSGRYSGGISWRYYSASRFVGCVGADLELLQRGFSYAPLASTTENEEDYLYYTRKLNSVMLPIVWQPHFYLVNHRFRVYLEAALTLSYNFDSSYINEVARENKRDDWQGKYEFKLTRDNRWGYGLAGGAGVAVLIGRMEVSAGVRYYFGYSDILRNRNKYYDNGEDGSENPFWYTPQRSPLDNMMIRVGVAYRFAPEFQSWSVKRHKREKYKEHFDFGK
jgi:hypothetical protein